MVENVSLRMESSVAMIPRWAGPVLRFARAAALLSAVLVPVRAAAADELPRPHPAFAAAAADPSLARFPRPVLVPSAAAALFDGLVLADARVWDDAAGAPFYGINAAPPGGELGLTAVGVGGSAGRAAYERMAGRDRDPACAEPATYCAWAPQPAWPPLGEAFYGLRLGGRPAVVSHRTCCRGESWSVSWYDPASDATYGL